ncbi:acyl-CoA dehydrogenase family protein [Propionibacteriaceae bacterium Y1685]|uniref:acyl-CoA dehydrogenase family protein n=1 Tax=Microlunatus sp. Y1700 TaxID=3418487 RepID=UPI003B7E7499
MSGSPALELYGTDTLLSAEERAVRDSVTAWAADHAGPHLRDWFSTGSPPVRELARELGQLGVLGMHLEGYGCAGAGAVAYGMACFALEAVDSGLRSLMSVQGSLAMFAIHRFGSTAQKNQWLPSMATGETIGCFGLTEAEFGSNPAGMRTRARRDGSDWILTGSKTWITNGTVAGVAVIWARTVEDGTDQGGRVRGFVVPTDAPGFSAREITDKLSLRASVTAELIMDDVRLPAEAVLPEAVGLSGPLSCLNEARFGIVFGSVGAADDSLEAARRYAADREVFGKPLGAHQLTQSKLADLTLDVGNAMLLALHLGRLKEAGTLRPEQVSLGKLNNVRTALAVAREARTILGANGITLDHSPLRHANNLESVLTYEGTSEIHTLMIGQALTGHSAYS